MSDRQLARAATSGRILDFYFVGESKSLHGYLVGSDDFHWLVAHTSEFSGTEYLITLVHKGSATRITISPEPTLDDELQSMQDFVRRIGGGFWQFCDKNYLGKSDPADPAFAPTLEPVS